MYKNISQSLSLLLIILVLLSSSSSILVLPVHSETLQSNTFSQINNNHSISNTTITTPIKHLVVIYPENIAFDHYFGTYPNAKSLPSEPLFSASPDTPTINGLTKSLLNNNTNLVNPFRLDRNDSKIVAICDNDHEYSAIQKAYNGGLLDKFIGAIFNTTSKGCNPNQPMGFFDGNTVTALWNYAQHFAMSDNFYSTNFGASLAGHLNLISGQTHGVSPKDMQNEVSNATLIGDPDSKFDDCSRGQTISLTGKNLGNLLNEKSITWGWFQGGFKPSNMITAIDNHNNNNTAVASSEILCNSAHVNVAGQNITDYVVHHEPFQYYNSTSNSHHLPPSSVKMIGYTDQANHQYDLSDFWNAAGNNSLPSISFLKPSQYQTGHPGSSDPLDEQTFIVNAINRLQKLPEWNNTAVIITYDDSGGWYDHVMPPIISQSSDPTYDTLLGPNGFCGHPPVGAYQDRCGYGGRLPMLIVSPWAKSNYIDHQITDQSSILRFIEDNWNLGRIGDQSFDEKAGSILNMFDFKTPGHYAKPLFLDPLTGLEK